MAIKYVCDDCKENKTKEDTRTITIHRRNRNVYLQRPVLNPNRKKLGTRLVCLDCLRRNFAYVESEIKKEDYAQQLCVEDKMRFKIDNCEKCPCITFFNENNIADAIQMIEDTEVGCWNCWDADDNHKSFNVYWENYCNGVWEIIYEGSDGVTDEEKELIKERIRYVEEGKTMSFDEMMKKIKQKRKANSLSA